MSILYSDYRSLGSVKIPLPTRGRQLRYHTFDLSNVTMPEGYEDYLPVVQHLCAQAGAFEGEATATVDEKVVLAGMSQRRPGPHVDGCFVAAAPVVIRRSDIKLDSWYHPAPAPMSGGYWGHGGGSGGWLHNCNNIPGKSLARMPVIVASSVPGCVAWKGFFFGEPKNDGDLSHLKNQLESNPCELLHANTGFLLSPDCIHESKRFDVDTPRTFLRIALPNDIEFFNGPSWNASL